MITSIFFKVLKMMKNPNNYVKTKIFFSTSLNKQCLITKNSLLFHTVSYSTADLQAAKSPSPRSGYCPKQFLSTAWKNLNQQILWPWSEIFLQASAKLVRIENGSNGVKKFQNSYRHAVRKGLDRNAFI